MRFFRREGFLPLPVSPASSRRQTYREIGLSLRAVHPSACIIWTQEKDTPMYSHKAGWLALTPSFRYDNPLHIHEAYRRCLPQKSSSPHQSPPQYSTGCSAYVLRHLSAFFSYSAHHRPRQE